MKAPTRVEINRVITEVMRRRGFGRGWKYEVHWTAKGSPRPILFEESTSLERWNDRNWCGHHRPMKQLRKALQMGGSAIVDCTWACGDPGDEAGFTQVGFWLPETRDGLVHWDGLRTTDSAPFEELATEDD